MEGVRPEDLEFILSKIENGFLFEKFVSAFLSGLLGYNFIPHGGIKDKGIDGLEYLYTREGHEKNLYQFSIEKNPQYKLMSTLFKLEENNIQYDQIIFVTNQLFRDKEKLIDEAIEKYKKPISIFDINWFSSNINTSPATVNAYRVFIDSYLYDFNQPGKSYIIGDMISDPRLFVFLRQQWDSNRKDLGLPKILADTLIIFALGDTDPNKGMVKNEEAIFLSIKAHMKFEPKSIQHLIRKRLASLYKQRKIQYHKALKGYCLPYETRLEIQQRNVDDSLIHEQFKSNIQAKLKTYLQDAEVTVKDCATLIEELLNRIFYEQGMEFADFILKGENQDAVEKRLPDLISSTIDTSSVINKNKEKVKGALLMAIRDIVYNGSPVDKEFLRRLSNTYLMLFLVQCDPKLAMYFSSLASNLNIYVCTSVIIPALSEYYLDLVNRRHWNLLKGAHEAGVKLVINECILKELLDHFGRIIRVFNADYKDNENLYQEEKDLIFVDEIMIRAYFYAKMRGRTSSFRDFLGNFIITEDINSSDAEHSILIFLKDTFGIEYFTDKSRDIHIDKQEEEKLFEKLKELKHSEVKAKVDAHLVLAIYNFREKRNEKSDRGIFGYKTWWLSKDVITHKTLCEILNKNIASCYIRPDFLYNYISLAPKKPEVDEAFKHIFPSLIGVNISFDLPKDVTSFVHQQIKEHKEKSPTMLKIALVNLSEHLIADSSYRTRDHVKHYLEENLKNKTS